MALVECIANKPKNDPLIGEHACGRGQFIYIDITNVARQIVGTLIMCDKDKCCLRLCEKRKINMESLEEKGIGIWHVRTDV